MGSVMSSVMKSITKKETDTASQADLRARVWVVEDSALESQRICNLLEGHYEVESFAEGAAMLERVSHHGTPDLVLLDWQMPGISGLDACRFLRERYDEVSLPILMLTARGAKQDFTEGLLSGANDYVAKPYDDAELLARVRTLVRTRQQAEALRQREEWFSTTLRSIGDAVITTRTDGSIDYVNRVAESLSGWSSQAAVDQPFDTVFDAFDEGSRKPVVNLLDAKAGAAAQVMMLRRKDGSEVAIEATVSLLGDEAARGAVVVFRDVTDRRTAERAAKKRADFEEKLIGIVSHDLRSPLNVVALSASLMLSRKKLDEVDTKTVERLRLTGQRATRLVRDLLDFTQSRLGGALPVTRRPTDLHVIASHVLEESETNAPGRPIKHEQSGSGAGKWDADRMAQMMMNLVSNAISYSPANSPITIRTKGEPDSVTVEVHNVGEPIPTELLTVIFEPMRRGAQTQGDRSVGLGLYIVKDIVDAHQGTIEVRSSAEEGTSFVMKLPRG